MLRIVLVAKTEEETVLKVEGWIAGRDVALLQAEGTTGLEEGRRLVLDLDGVQFIDEEGIALLQTWPAERRQFRGGSIYVRALLEGRGLA